MTSFSLIITIVCEFILKLESCNNSATCLNIFCVIAKKPNHLLLVLFLRNKWTFVSYSAYKKGLSIYPIRTCFCFRCCLGNIRWKIIEQMTFAVPNFIGREILICFLTPSLLFTVELNFNYFVSIFLILGTLTFQK